MIAVKENRPRRANIIIAPEFIPLCPVHGCDMQSYSRRRSIVYFHCIVDGCNCCDKASRKVFVVQPNPPRP